MRLVPGFVGAGHNLPYFVYMYYRMDTGRMIESKGMFVLPTDDPKNAPVSMIQI